MKANEERVSKMWEDLLDMEGAKGSLDRHGEDLMNLVADKWKLDGHVGKPQKIMYMGI